MPPQEYVATTHRRDTSGNKKSKLDEPAGKTKDETKKMAGDVPEPLTPHPTQDLAIKQLLDYERGDRFIVRGQGYTTGWLLVERVSPTSVSANERMRMRHGNVEGANLERLPHDAHVTHEWRMTHCIEMLHQVSPCLLL